MGFVGDVIVWFVDASTRSIARFGDYLTARPSQRGGGCSAFGYWMEEVSSDPDKVRCHAFFTRFRRP